MNNAIISVGSNVDAFANIEKAGVIIERDQKLLQKSAFVRTKPVDIEGQPDFLNGAFFVETVLDMDGLNGYLKGVEASLGRPPVEERTGPRTIDLDIIVFNNRVVSSDFDRYAFVREAVLELAPELIASKA